MPEDAGKHRWFVSSLDLSCLGLFLSTNVYFIVCLVPIFARVQIPRVDISAPANAIEYHPALLAHADEHAASAPPPPVPPPPKPTTVAKDGSDTDSLGSDLSDDDWDGMLTDDDSLGSDHTDVEALASMSPSEKAENERFGAEYTGPKLNEKESARLLILMAHASTCPCR